MRAPVLFCEDFCHLLARLLLVLFLQAMEAAFAVAAEAGEKRWFQSSKDEMRIKISRSDQICDRMLKMLRNKDEDDQDEEDEDNDSR